FDDELGHLGRELLLDHFQEFCEYHALHGWVLSRSKSAISLPRSLRVCTAPYRLSYHLAGRKAGYFSHALSHLVMRPALCGNRPRRRRNARGKVAVSGVPQFKDLGQAVALAGKQLDSHGEPLLS